MVQLLRKNNNLIIFAWTPMMCFMTNPWEKIEGKLSRQKAQSLKICQIFKVLSTIYLISSFYTIVDAIVFFNVFLKKKGWHLNGALF